MKRVDIREFLDMLNYTPKYVGEELYDPVRFVEFRMANCNFPSMEFGTKPDTSRGGQLFYFEVVDFRNYDTAKGDIISDDRRHGVINTYLNSANARAVADRVNACLKNVYSKKGPIW